MISEKLIDAERRAFLSILASSIGHEINNSLTAIQGHIEIAKLPDATDPIRQKAIQITWSQLVKLKTLTNNLLQLGKPGENFKRASEPIDLNECVESVIDVFQKTSRLKNCKIHFKPEPIPVIVESNQDQLSLLLSNIVLNSADATGNQGNIQISVYIKNTSSRRVCFGRWGWNGRRSDSKDLSTVFYYKRNWEGNWTRNVCSQGNCGPTQN